MIMNSMQLNREWGEEDGKGQHPLHCSGVTLRSVQDSQLCGNKRTMEGKFEGHCNAIGSSYCLLKSLEGDKKTSHVYMSFSGYRGSRLES